MTKKRHLQIGRVQKNVQFQKISMPTPRKVNGNSKGEGDFKSPVFLTKVLHQNGISGGVGVQFRKTFRGRDIDIF